MSVNYYYYVLSSATRCIPNIPLKFVITMTLSIFTFYNTNSCNSFSFYLCLNNLFQISLEIMFDNIIGQTLCSVVGWPNTEPSKSCTHYEWCMLHYPLAWFIMHYELSACSPKFVSFNSWMVFLVHVLTYWRYLIHRERNRLFGRFNHVIVFIVFIIFLSSLLDW